MLIPQITEEQIKRALKGEDIELIQAPGPGKSICVNADLSCEIIDINKPQEVTCCEHGEFPKNLGCYQCGMMETLGPWAKRFGDRVEKSLEGAAKKDSSAT